MESISIKQEQRRKERKDRIAIRKLADDICKELYNNNFHVLRYDSAYSTYLKVDGGLCHSIRVSNHKSKKTELSYRYYIMIDCLDNDYVTSDERGYKNYYARKCSTFKVIDLIKQHRESCICKYGELNYYNYVLTEVNKNIWKTKDSKGFKSFWAKSKTVKFIYKKEIEYFEGIWTKSLINKISKLNKIA